MLKENGMDAFQHAQETDFFMVAVYWTIAIVMGGALAFLIKNAERWKALFVSFLSLEQPMEMTQQPAFVTAKEVGPGCPHCQRPMVRRRSRSNSSLHAYRWACASVPRCDRIGSGARSPDSLS